MAVNDFLAYATNVLANVLTQAEYAANAALPVGVVSGVASSALYNKTARQGAFWGAVLGQTIVDQLTVDCLDDGDLAGKVTLFQNAVLKITSLYAPINNPTLTGNVNVPTQAPGNNTTLAATTAFVTAAITALNTTLTAAINLKAPLNSPGLTGVPTTTTPSSGDSSSQIPTTAWTRARDSETLSSALTYGCKAHVHFNSAGSVIDSLNLISISKISTGRFNIAFTISGGGSRGSHVQYIASSVSWLYGYPQGSFQNAISQEVQFRSTANTLTDPSEASVVVF